MTGIAAKVAVRALTLPADFHVSWAGPCPSWIAADVCLGSEEGRLFFSPGEGRLHPGDNRFLGSGEAVNGVAFLGNDRIAISSRSELSFMTVPRHPGETPLRAVFPAGAHGVIAAASGYFVAPLGPSGIMMYKPGSQQPHPLTVHRFDPALNLYRAISIVDKGAETLVFAARSEGIISVGALGDPTTKLDSHHCWESSDKSDIIDVCSLAPQTRSIAALNWDNEILLIRDVLSETERPAPFQFPGIAGTAYRILSMQGHLVVLTSRSLYVLEGLGHRFLEGHPVHREPTRVASFPMDAVDINPCGEGQFLVVLPEAVNMIDLGLLLGGPNGAKPSNGAPEREVDFVTARVPTASNDRLTQRSVPQYHEPVHQEPIHMPV